MENRELTSDEFNKILEHLDKLFGRAVECFAEAAKLLGQLSRDRLKEVKARYKGKIKPDFIERLALFGQNKIAEYLAQEVPLLPASTLRLESVRKVVNDPDRVVEVYLPARGRVLPKRICELNAREIAQVLDPKGQLRTARQQRSWINSQQPEIPASKRPKDELDYDGFSAGDNGFVRIFCRYQEDEPNTRRFALCMKLTDLRRLTSNR